MSRFNETGSDRAGTADPVVVWTTYEADGFVHAVADVPRSIPKSSLGFAATDTEAALFVGTPSEPRWTVTLPIAVNPTPVSVSYNNGIFEAVFTAATADPLDAIGDSVVDTK